MKPTPQISAKRAEATTFSAHRLPVSNDCVVSRSRRREKNTDPRVELKTFRKLSTEFFATEIPRDYIAELFFFILITGIAAWPIISSMVAITRLVRNY